MLHAACLSGAPRLNSSKVTDLAGVAELADALALGASGRKVVVVRVHSPAPTLHYS